MKRQDDARSIPCTAGADATLKRRHNSGTKHALTQDLDQPLATRRKSKSDSFKQSNDLREIRPVARLAGIPTEKLMDHIPSAPDLRTMFGTRTDVAAYGLLAAALEGLGEGGQNYRSFVLAMGAEMEPQDALEAMLVTQMATTHAAMAQASHKAADADTVQAMDAHDRIGNRLRRTFLAQLEAWRKYRSEGEQTVRVEHVTVNDGGQAIVGQIESGGRDKNETRR